MNRLLAASPPYLVVSALCMGLNVVLFIVLEASRVHYAITVAISAMLLIPLSYSLHRSFTYRVEGGLHSFLRYAGAQVVNSPIALVLFYLVHDRLALPMVWAAPLITALMFAYNFLSSFWALAPRVRKRFAPRT